MNLAAVILAGGESRRMGRDKAWLPFGGRPLIVHALATVRDAGIKEVFVSGRVGTDYSELKCPVLYDRQTGCGPLGGIERALDAATAPLLLALAVDLPRMSAAFLRQLATRTDSLTGVVPEVRDQLEPLAAVYPKRCGAIAQNCLRQGRYAARGFANACLRQRAVRTFTASRADAIYFENWNTRWDVVQLEPSLRCCQGAQVGEVGAQFAVPL
jgi:molybdenum cofactor guanylyltransferase